MATGKPESPTEPFKRALAHAARSLAEQPDLEVVFSGDGPSLVGNRATFDAALALHAGGFELARARVDAANLQASASGTGAAALPWS